MDNWGELGEVTVESDLAYLIFVQVHDHVVKLRTNTICASIGSDTILAIWEVVLSDSR